MSGTAPQYLPPSIPPRGRERLLGFLRSRAPGGDARRPFPPRPGLSLEIQRGLSSPAERRASFASALGRLKAEVHDLVGSPDTREALRRVVESLRPAGPEGEGARAAIDRDPFWGRLGQTLGPGGMPGLLSGAGFQVVEAPGEGGSSAAPVLAACALGVSVADLAVAETGSLVEFSRPWRPRSLSLLPPAHLAVVPEERLLGSLEDLLARAHAEVLGQGMMGLITGPSRTADIEKVLTLGVHGPGRLVVVLVDVAGD